MGLYSDILTAVKARLAAITALAAASPRLRKAPTFVMLQDTLPQVIFAPPAHLSEKVDELQFDNQCFLVFDVYVGIATRAEWDETMLFWRTDARELIRLALWRDDLIALSGDYEFRCDYDPAPSVPPSAGPNTDESWQLFSFKVSTSQNGG